MSERKIPAFLSAAHHAASSIEAKRKLLEAYDIWACSDITKSYIIFLEKELQRLLKEDEEKTDWLSRFHFRYKEAHNKGQRGLLRKLLQQIKP
jgi:hypothetical protein